MEPYLPRLISQRPDYTDFSGTIKLELLRHPTRLQSTMTPGCVLMMRITFSEPQTPKEQQILPILVVLGRPQLLMGKLQQVGLRYIPIQLLGIGIQKLVTMMHILFLYNSIIQALIPWKLPLGPMDI